MIVVEYGLRVDCEKNGCAEPHHDNGVVINLSEFQPFTNPRERETWKESRLGKHAAERVARIITYDEWIAYD